MSRRKDRERAESGLIFRSGKLWKKTEWEALHHKGGNPPRVEPTPEQKEIQQAVDSFVKEVHRGNHQHLQW